MEKRADSVLKDISLKEASQDLQADFDELRREMANLKSYQKDIDKQIKDIPKESKDVIWQSEEARRILKNQVEKTRGRLMDNLKSVEEAFGIMLTILGKKNRRKK